MPVRPGLVASIAVAIVAAGATTIVIADNTTVARADLPASVLLVDR